MARCPACDAQATDAARFCARCGAVIERVAADGDDPLLGRVLLERYRVCKVLGEGGMGTVYLAEQQMGQATRPVALKTLRRDLTRDPRFAGRFRRESEIVVQLSHPNTIQFYDFGTLQDGTLVIAMEYIDGRTLAAELRKGPLPAHRIDHLLEQICGSLDEAHARGIVHRDLKPQNILLTRRGGSEDFVKVVDFGIALKSASDAEDDTRLTTQGTLIGTPPYMSPEQFQGSDVDARSDVYALAVMAYEMTTGTLPFEARTPWEWATAHLTEVPRPPTERVPELDPARARALLRGLAKDPAARPASARAFLDALRGEAPQDAVGEGAPTVPLRARGRPQTSSDRAEPLTRGALATPGTTPAPARRSRLVTWLPVVLLLGAGVVMTVREADAPGASEATARRRPGSATKSKPKVKKPSSDAREREQDAQDDALARTARALDAGDLDAAMSAYARVDSGAASEPRAEDIRTRLATLATRRLHELVAEGFCDSAARMTDRLARMGVQAADGSALERGACAEPLDTTTLAPAASAEDAVLQ